jgi:heme/copper-type cytochrome/quinol oxidase subunit 4
MPTDMSITQIIAMVAPLAALQIGLQVFCMVKIIREGTANLNKIVWGIIVLSAGVLGPIFFLLLGKRRDA